MKTKILSILLLFAFFSLGTGNPADLKDEKSCTVYVKWYSTSGDPAEGKKVVGYTSTRTLSTEGTNIAYTNSDGKVTLNWNSYKDLRIIYVDGTKHEGNYKNGGTYTFVLD